MTRRTSRTRSGDHFEQTRRHFLFARAQVSAHASAAEYVRVRDLTRHASRAAASDPDRIAANPTT